MKDADRRRILRRSRGKRTECLETGLTGYI